jgi:general secretion pathway protein D
LGSGSFGPNGGAGTSTPAPPAGGGIGAPTSQNQNSGGTVLAAAFEAFSDKKGSDSDTDSASGAPPGASGPRGVLPNVRISADVPNNAVVVYSNEGDYRIVERALYQIDRPKLQVAIEATVAEVTLTDELQFGVQYFLTSHDVGLGKNNGSIGLLNAPPSSVSTDATSAATAAAAVATTFLSRAVPGFNLLLGPEAQPRVILNALSTLTDVNVLSSPSIVVLDNQPALLQVGDEIPITTSSATILASSATPVVNTIEMRNTGVILKVLPHVHPNGTIQLEIDQEISNVTNQAQQTLTPTISERRIHSTVALVSRQTVLLGGLISEVDQNTRSGIPGLMQINWLGHLFGNTSHDRQRTEIIVFIRPQLIRNGYDAQNAASEFRERLDMMRQAIPVVGKSPPIVVSK